MLAKYERITYFENERVWVGKYKNLHNIAHWHLEHELIACCHGHAKVMINDHLFDIGKGKCVFCHGGSVHYIETDEGSIMLVAIFDERIVHGITSAYGLVVPAFSDKYNVISKLNCILQELSGRSLFFEEFIKANLMELIIDVFRGEELEPYNAEVGITVTRFKQLLNIIDKEYEFISFSDAAEFMNFSEAYFSKYFKRQAGMTFSQYLNVVKVEKAVNFLASDPNIKMAELMSRCGFNTIRSFNRTFHIITGYSPKHLPKGYSLNTRSVRTVQSTFNPTLDSSELL